MRAPIHITVLPRRRTPARLRARLIVPIGAVLVLLCLIGWLT